jgi:hypothetical protein
MESAREPKYIQDASFIEEDRSIDEQWWRDSAFCYLRTNNWRKRADQLAGVITEDRIYDVMEYGDIYPAAKGNAAFVDDEDGVAVYVVVSSELNVLDGKYPTTPTKLDYTFKRVTLWAHVFDKAKATKGNIWSDRDIRTIDAVCG